MWLYMYATVFVRLSTQGVKKKLKTGALIEISKIQTFYLSETVSGLKIMAKIANIDVFVQKKVVIYDDLRGRLFMFCW